MQMLFISLLACGVADENCGDSHPPNILEDQEVEGADLKDGPQGGRTVQSFHLGPEEVTVVYTDPEGNTWKVVYSVLGRQE